MNIIELKYIMNIYNTYNIKGHLKIILCGIKFNDRLLILCYYF